MIGEDINLLLFSIFGAFKRSFLIQKILNFEIELEILENDLKVDPPKIGFANFSEKTPISQKHKKPHYFKVYTTDT